jgi:rubrerythrin
MKRYHCLECGHIFELKDKLMCPICKNSKEELLLKTIEIKEVVESAGLPNYKNTDKELRDKLEHFTKRRNHSSAYLKVCAYKLIELGYFDLALILERIAVSKLDVETKLIDALGVTDNMRLNLNNLITKAIEDVKLAKELEELAKIKHDDEIYKLLNSVAIEEACNLVTLNTVLDKLIKKENE